MTDSPWVVACECNNNLRAVAVRISANKKTNKEVKAVQTIEGDVQYNAKKKPKTQYVVQVPAKKIG